ncbi:TonB-dependent receptor [Halioxenophilus sp. WMMB6]|uniref:TonB-dependent receptor n=1 Tax=Halioxenophilus sp. WMMB6 TaxID=3073815 RepID=UPI00295E6A5C|nr:TonB-dependent receptor [Halioxenophilus sp. WMMB6]
MALYKQSQLALAIAATLSTGVSFADTTSESTLPIGLEEVSVLASPIRDSQRSAILAKRLADNYVDVVSADTIGRFPDQNLADSLARVPGLAVERDQGQARYLNFRGAPFRYTSLAIDGLQLPGAENGRVPRFDSFPSVITSRIEANKAVLASMPGESIAGYINIETFDPFAKEGLGLAVNMGRGEQDLGGGDVESNSLRASWSDEQFGVMLYGSDDSREQLTDNREYELEQADDGRLIPLDMDFRSYQVKRENQSYGGQFEYRFDDGASRLFVSSLYSEFKDHERRNQFVFGLGDFVDVTPGNSGYQPIIQVQRMLQDGEYSNSTDAKTLGLDYQAGDWLLEARLSRTETEYDMYLPIVRSVYGTAAAEYDISNLENPKLFLYQPMTQTEMALSDVNYAATIGLPITSSLSVESNQFKFDASRDVNFAGLDHSVQMGLVRDQRQSDGHALAITVTGFPSEVDIDSFNTGRSWETDFTNTVGGTYYDNAGVLSAWRATGADIKGSVGADQVVTIDEDITAVYAMSTTHFDWGSLNYGVRVEYTDYSASGPDADYSDNFTNVLPSLHLNYNVADDQKLRLSLTSGITRPTYNEWRASASVDVINEAITGGNPALEEEQAWGSDIAYEWYLGDSSLLAVGAFYRTIDNVIYQAVSTIDPGIYYAPAAGETWDFVGTVNGKDGELSGVEFNVITQAADLFHLEFDNPLAGLGFSGNLSLLDSEFTTREGQKFSLPGTSDMVYNASLFYEVAGLSVRLNYQYRDAWLTVTESSDFAEYWDENERMDLAISYTLPMDIYGAELSFYLNANNLTDAVDVRYQGSSATPNQVERYGRRYLAGVRINF